MATTIEHTPIRGRGTSQLARACTPLLDCDGVNRNAGTLEKRSTTFPDGSALVGVPFTETVETCCGVTGKPKRFKVTKQRVKLGSGTVGAPYCRINPTDCCGYVGIICPGCGGLEIPRKLQLTITHVYPEPGNLCLTAIRVGFTMPLLLNNWDPNPIPPMTWLGWVMQNGEIVLPPQPADPLHWCLKFGIGLICGLYGGDIRWVVTVNGIIQQSNIINFTTQSGPDMTYLCSAARPVNIVSPPGMTIGPSLGPAFDYIVTE
jgi:hypothetical protein